MEGRSAWGPDPPASLLSVGSRRPTGTGAASSCRTGNVGRSSESGRLACKSDWLSRSIAEGVEGAGDSSPVAWKADRSRCGTEPTTDPGANPNAMGPGELVASGAGPEGLDGPGSYCRRAADSNDARKVASEGRGGPAAIGGDVLNLAWTGGAVAIGVDPAGRTAGARGGSVGGRGKAGCGSRSGMRSSRTRSARGRTSRPPRIVLVRWRIAGDWRRDRILATNRASELMPRGDPVRCRRNRRAGSVQRSKRCRNRGSTAARDPFSLAFAPVVDMGSIALRYCNLGSVFVSRLTTSPTQPRRSWCSRFSSTS